MNIGPYRKDTNEHVLKSDNYTAKIFFHNSYTSYIRNDVHVCCDSKQICCIPSFQECCLNGSLNQKKQKMNQLYKSKICLTI